jgi:hypothetical protein
MEDEDAENIENVDEEEWFTEMSELLVFRVADIDADADMDVDVDIVVVI